MVDHPDPEPASTPDHGEGGMPAATERAFQSHADTQLGHKVQQTIDEIERVYEQATDAVVSCSGGKDSMAVLALAQEANCAHRVSHWDYGPTLIPRDLEQEIVGNIRSLTPDRYVFVANDAMRIYKPFQKATTFYEQLHSDERVADTPSVRDTDEGKPIARARERLFRSTKRGILGRQVLGTRRGESGSRDEYIDALFGKSMGLDAAFPIRDWSARDVWGYIVSNDIPYASHYDRIAAVVDDGSPDAYEGIRMGAVFRTFRTPYVDDEAVHGVAEWRNRSSLTGGSDEG